VKRVFFILCCLFLLTGCWDRIELKEIGIVSAIGVDRDPDTGEILFTSQVVDPSGLKPDGGGTASAIQIESSKADTVFKAFRDINQEFDRKNFYAHNKVIIIGEELAKEGILPVLDGITRGKEGRGYIWLCVTKGTQARDILINVRKQGIEKVPANSIESMHENTELNFDVAVIKLNDYYKKTLKSGIEPVIGTLEMTEKSTNNNRESFGQSSLRARLSGGAVIKEDKLVGFLNEAEARGYNWVVGEVKSGILSIPSLLDDKKLVSIEIREASSKIKPEIKGDKISFTIDIKSAGILVEQQGSGTLKTRKEQYDYLKRLEKELEKKIESEVYEVVEKAQEDFNSDIFGFGTRLNKKDSKKWKEIKEAWSKDQFQNVDVKVKVKAEISARELLQEPLKSID